MPLSHYLDDFFFVSRMKEKCQFCVNTFSNVCEYINFPIAPEKMVNSTQRLEFLGIEIDMVRMVLRVPESKLKKALKLLDSLLARRHCKVREIQVVTGLLNFLMRAVHNAHCFICRIYDMIKGHPQHYHVQISSGAKKDMLMWKKFLVDFHCLGPIPTYKFVTNDDLDFFTDSSAKLGNGFWIVFKNSWAFGVWDSQFLAHKSSIMLLELYSIVQAVLIWGDRIKDQHVVIWSDNMAYCEIVNSQTSRCSLCLTLLRYLILSCLKFNIDLRCIHVPGKLNARSDSLSCIDFQRF